MRGVVFRLLFLKPGGWPYSAGPPPKDGYAAITHPNNEPPNWFAVTAGGLLFAILPVFFGIDFAWRFYLMLALPFICIILARLVRRWIFSDVPANEACLFPKNQRQDCRRRYVELVLIVSTVWILSLVMLIHCVLTMKAGMGDEWNPFTRTIRLTKNGPYSEYGAFQMVMFISGFFAITGLLWWPMYVFFEWLSARQQISKMEAMTSA